MRKHRVRFYFFSLAIYLFHLCSCSENSDVSNEAIKTREESNTESVFDKTTYYPNKNIRERYDLSNEGEKKNGKYESYYKNGQMMSKGTLKNNYPVGKWEYYMPSGKIFTKRE